MIPLVSYDGAVFFIPCSPSTEKHGSIWMQPVIRIGFNSWTGEKWYL